MKSNELAAADPAGRVERCRRTRGRCTGIAVACAGMLLSVVARGAPAGERGTAVTGLAAVSMGRGLRFNNPYRLATPLGETAESVSLSASYLDLSLATLFGADDVRHGASLSGALAVQGIGQLALTPSYLLEFAAAPALDLRGRLGAPLVVAPDASLGLEAAVGSRFAVAYGLGLTAELVGSLFFGAATEEVSVTTIPILALQIGICFEHEVSP